MTSEVAARSVRIASEVLTPAVVVQKIIAAIASTGTRRHRLFPAGTLPGDLGQIPSDDVMLALSWTADTHDIRLMPTLRGVYLLVFAVTKLAVRGDFSDAPRQVLDCGPSTSRGIFHEPHQPQPT